MNETTHTLGNLLLPNGQVVDAGGPIRDAYEENGPVFLCMDGADGTPMPLGSARITDIRAGTDTSTPDVAIAEFDAPGRGGESERAEITLTVPPTIKFVGNLAITQA